MISGILTGLVLLCPLAVGFAFQRKETVNWNSLIEAYVSGQFLLWGLFQLIAVPLVHMRAGFDILVYAFLFALLLSVIIGVIRKKDCKLNLRINISKSILVWLLLLALIFAIGIPIYKYIFEEHIDQDDARFIAEANDALYYNTMFLHNPATGDYIGRFTGEMVKEVNSPWPMYIAFLSRITMNHPATMAHTIYAPVLVLFSYLIYWQLGCQLFKGIHERLLFLLAVSVINLYFAGPAMMEGAPPVHMMTRIWQGKSVVQSIAIPGFMFQFMVLHQETKKRNWLLLLAMSFASCLLSGMGIVIAIIMLAVYGGYRMICKRFNGFWWLVLCLVPPIVYEAIYIQMGR